MKTVDTQIRWIGKLAYMAHASGHEVLMDGKKTVGGQDLGMTPKELLLSAICGCTGMDVISMLSSKFKLPVKTCEVSAQADLSEGKAPTVYERVRVSFDLTGDLPADKVTESVVLSMKKYCGVTAMISKACPVTYGVRLNGELISEGQAFP